MNQNKFPVTGERRMKSPAENIFLKTLAALILLFSSFAFATHNPSVSHSASGITNGTFQDNYSNLEVGL